MVATVVLIYGILVLLGGGLGYAKAKSLPSLLSGSVFGVLLIICSILMFQAKSVGTYTALLLSFFLGIFFAFRYKGSRKFMPAGLMIVLSLVTFIVLLTAIF